MSFNIENKGATVIEGCIYKVPFPFTDLSKTKYRPALALDNPDANGDVRFMFITATPVESSKQGFQLKKDDFDEEPLPFDSYIRLEKSLLLHQSIVQKKLAKLTEKAMAKLLRQYIKAEIPKFVRLNKKNSLFIPGQSSVPVSGKVLGEADLEYLVDASLDGWLTTGRFNEEFEQKLADFLNVKHVLTTNSGSSANLLAIAALSSETLGSRALKKGDEVVTVAAGFPTTVNPILQYGLVPVFIDITLPSYNIDVTQIESAITNKTKAIMLAHTLGNPFNIQVVTQLARKHNLWLIEDCCDALGTLYTPTVDLQDTQGKTIPANSQRHVGIFGDIATLSFYPAHHITMGEGGALFTNNAKLKLIIESFRDWGRDCFCPPGHDNTCKKRYCYQRGELPAGYDHKYTYSHVGYNLKITDMQAAVGVAQLEKLPTFIQARKTNYAKLRRGLETLQAYLILPEATENADVSWFGFPITLIQHERSQFIAFLDQKKIASRLLFGGNLTKQPYFKDQHYRIINDLENTDKVMNNTLWLGVYPGLDEAMIDYMMTSIKEFFIGNK